MEIIASYDKYRFLPAGFFSYDASEDIINYDPRRLRSPAGKISLLHEISHCELGHFNYRYDMELLMMEIDAWNYTKTLAKKHDVYIDDGYIEQCIESYDTWVTKRATCPKCDNFCLEESENIYSCYVCSTRWKVSSEPQKQVSRKVIRQ